MFNISSNPHVKDRITTQKVMLYVIIALLPTTLFGIFNYTSMFGLKYGIRTILLIAYCVAVCVVILSFTWGLDDILNITYPPFFAQA